MSAKLALWLLNLFGWRISGHTPQLAQYLIIGAPHTSNWDFVVAILARVALRIDVHFIAKHQLFHPLWGWFFRALGGIPVDRRKSQDLVNGVVQLYRENPQLILGLAPEGTRSQVTRWKTGFYHIAKGAGVAIVPLGLDFGSKTIHIGSPHWPGQNMCADMAQLLAFFRPLRGKHRQAIPHFISKR